MKATSRALLLLYAAIGLRASAQMPDPAQYRINKSDAAALLENIHTAEIWTLKPNSKADSDGETLLDGHQSQTLAISGCTATFTLQKYWMYHRADGSHYRSRQTWVHTIPIAQFADAAITSTDKRYVLNFDLTREFQWKQVYRREEREAFEDDSKYHVTKSENSRMTDKHLAFFLTQINAGLNADAAIFGWKALAQSCGGGQ